MAREKICGVYMMKSKVHPDRFYVGSALDVHSRWSKHKSNLVRQVPDKNKKLLNHFNKYGWDDFVLSVLERCDREELLVREQYYIDTLKPWFNICPKAGSGLGRKLSAETKEKVRQANLGKKQSEETIEKRRLANIGQTRPPFTEEHKRRISESKKGKPSTTRGIKRTKPVWNKGKKGVYSEETLAKIREPRPYTSENIKKSWIKRKEEGKVGERDSSGRFVKKK